MRMVDRLLLIRREIENANRDKAEHKQDKLPDADLLGNNILLIIMLNEKHAQELREIQDKQNLLLKITELLDISTKISLAIKKVSMVIESLTESIQQNRKSIVDYLIEKIATSNMSPENKRKIIKNIENISEEFISNHHVSTQQFKDQAREIINSVLSENAPIISPNSTVEKNSTNCLTSTTTFFTSLDEDQIFLQKQNSDVRNVATLEDITKFYKTLIRQEQELKEARKATSNSGELHAHKSNDQVQANIDKITKCLESINPSVIEKVVNDVTESASKVIDMQNSAYYHPS